MRGSKYSDEIKEKALAMLTTMTVKEVSKKLDIADNTLRDWKNEAEKINPEFVKLRDEKKKEFVENAWSIIGKANTLLERKIDRAISQESDIDKTINIVARDPELSKEEKKSIIKKLNELKLDNLGQLSIVIGTLYDKQALINKESTVNHGVADTLESVLRNITGDEM